MTDRTLLAEMRWRHVVETVPGEPFTRVATGERGVHPDVQVCRFCETDWPCDAAQLLDRLAVDERVAALDKALRRAAEDVHDFALTDPDIGGEHTSTPWTTCPAEPCTANRAALR